MTVTYADLLARKHIAFEPHGLAHIPDLHPGLFPHQRAVTEFALRCGSAAMFLDTGLGKSFAALEWGRVVVEKTNKPVLMLAPLAVGPQHQREAERFGIDALYVRDGSEVTEPRIYITNYERLDSFIATQFVGIILDESSVIKSFTGKTTRKLISTFAKTPYRLCCTATPAPNDHTELGTHAEFLGVMRREEMLPRWFINDTADTGTWRIKGHAAGDFWRWVASWARCVSLPSDLGFDDAGYVLPPISVHEHLVKADRTIDAGEELRGKLVGQHRLFRMPDTSATAIHVEKRLTAKERAKLAAEIVFEDWSCGSQNTPSAAEPNIKTTLLNEIGARNKDGRQKRIKNTCAHITEPTRNAGTETKSSAPSAMPVAERDMRKTASTEKKPRPAQSFATRNFAVMASSKPPSALPQQNTIASPASKVAAPSAAHLPLMEGGTGSPLTTITAPGPSADSSALPATRASASSRTIRNCLNEQSTTSNERDWWVVWCDSDYEQDELERLFGDVAISIRGSMMLSKKEELHEAWLRGERKVLICKPVMFGYGVNWQHCSKMIFAGLSFSYENYYQAVRRCWRFGQKNPVEVHIAMADTEAAIKRVIDRKADDHGAMKREMATAMREAVLHQHAKVGYAPTANVQIPDWMRQAS